jgi:hypothetical protein
MRAILFLLLCAWSSAGYAQNDSTSNGNTLLPACKNFISVAGGGVIDAFKQGECTGVVRVLLRVGEALAPKFQSCHPQEATLGQAVRVVIQFLETRPERLHEDFIPLAAEAMSIAWPCKK